MSKVLLRIVLAVALVLAMLASATVPFLQVETVLATTTTFYPAADAYVEHDESNLEWWEIRAAAGTDAVDDNANHYQGIGYYCTNVTYQTYTWLDRTIVTFDTSSISDDAIITAATLSLYGYSKSNSCNTSPNINIYSASPNSSTNIVAGDFDSLGSTAYSTSISYSSWSVSGFNSFSLNSTGKTAVSLTGYTKIGVRNAGYDVGNVNPDASANAGDGIYFYNEEKGTGYKPKLDITYYVISAPEITANDASNITQLTARLNSTVGYDGGEACDVRFGYGDETQTAENFESYDTVTDWVVDTYTTGQHPYVDVESLVADTGYYFCVQIRNSDSTVTSDEVEFTTLSSLAAPTNFVAIPEANEINLFWTKGYGASTTMIRYSIIDYPATTSDGTLLYNSTGSNTTHTGLSAGSTIYYTAWGISGEDESDPVELLATTLAGSDVDTDLTSPIEPTNWFLDVDPTTLSNFEPVYSWGNDLADGISMPRTTMWFLIAITACVAVAFGVYRWRKTLLGAGIVLLICMSLTSAMHLMPGWIIFVTGAVIVSVGYSASKAQ